MRCVRFSSTFNFFFVLNLCISFFAHLLDNASAQSTPITSSSLHTQISKPIVSAGKTQYDITGGTRHGTNLFHSFGNFDVPLNNIANFRNDSGLATSNILGRVTGGARSEIFGAIQTTGFGNANLFLMNPAGFLFGPQATVNVGGILSFTSADYLKLKDGARFNATPNPATDAVLTSSPVAAFGFLGSNPGAITVQGSQFQVADGKGISLIGGNVTIKSNPDKGHQTLFSAPNGMIQMTSTTSPGEFNPALSAASTGDAPNSTALQPDNSINSSKTGTEPAASIQIVSGALRMNGAQIIHETTWSGTPGKIYLYAQDSISITDSFISSSSNSAEAKAGPGGQIILQAPIVELAGSTLSSATYGPGTAGNISVYSNLFSLLGSENSPSDFIATTSGTGNGGNISILGFAGPGSRASNVTLSGESSLRSETQGGKGNAGNITVETLRLTLKENSQITTASLDNSSGNAGAITLKANTSALISNSFVFSDVWLGSTGTGGQITITTPNLTVDLGGQISTSTTSPSSIGNAGTITINSNSVTLNAGGQIFSSSHLDDPVYPPARGAAGTVAIQGITGPNSQANNITINGRDTYGGSSGIFTDTTGSGRGGNITVRSNQLKLTNGATISANSAGVNDAGSIYLTAINGLSMQDSAITTEVAPSHTGNRAGGGNIAIFTSPAATIHLQNSRISASVADGPGGGGNIVIDPQFIILQNNSRIVAQAAQGTGGNITMVTELFLSDASSVVNADSGSGLNGTVTIQSPISQAGGKIQPLGKSPLPATSLLNQRCAALAKGQFSSFTMTGQNNLPMEPGGWLLTPLALFDPLSGDGAVADTHLGGNIDNRAVKPLRLSLRHITPGFLPKTFTRDWPTGCRS